MYLGRIVEEGTRDGLYGRPTHPYTQSASVGRAGSRSGRSSASRRRIVLQGRDPQSGFAALRLHVPPALLPRDGALRRRRCRPLRPIPARRSHVACHHAGPLEAGERSGCRRLRVPLDGGGVMSRLNRTHPVCTAASCRERARFCSVLFLAAIAALAIFADRSAARSACRRISSALLEGRRPPPIGSAPTNSDATSSSRVVYGARTSLLDGRGRGRDRGCRSACRSGSWRVLRRLARRGADARRRCASGAARHPLRHGDDRGARPKPGGGAGRRRRHRHSELCPRHARAGAFACASGISSPRSKPSAASSTYNMFRTILPNSWSPILVQVVVLVLGGDPARGGAGVSRRRHSAADPELGRDAAHRQVVSARSAVLRRAPGPRADADDPVVRHHRASAHRRCSKTGTRSSASSSSKRRKAMIGFILRRILQLLPGAADRVIAASGR